MPAPSAIFTIVSANYIAFAATLMQSVRRYHPDVPRFIVLSDALHSFGDLDLAAEVIACDDLGIALIGNMKLWYTVIEFNTAVKPFTFRHLFAERGFESAIYLDPDIQLYAPMEEVFTGLEDHSLVLTPHMMKPLDDGKHPSDLSIMKAGVYNFGFVALKNDQDGRGLIRWWSDRLFAHCRVDVPGNMFTDQRWMDLSPAFVERPLLLRHPGYNVAYWNLVHRTIDQDEHGEWRANGRPLVFFHFSGIKPEDPTVFSKHQDRFTIETLGVVADLCVEYRNCVLGNGWLTYNKIPYAFGTFADGRAILDPMRNWLLRAIDDDHLPMKKPLRLGSAFFDAADDAVFADGGRLTRFAYQFWLDRPDLQGAFNLQQPAGYQSYVSWFCDGSAERERVPSEIIQAAKSLRDHGPGAGAALPPTFVAPPWPSLAAQAWGGPARDAELWLMGEVRFEAGGAQSRLQRQAALLWERRVDLQQFFPLDSQEQVEKYHLWTLTDGMKEGSIKPHLFTAEYLGWLDDASSISRLYGDVPITRGMALTRGSAYARTGLQAWTEFPLNAKARQEQAFWYAFFAPQEFGWPAAATASALAYFNSPSDLHIGTYPLSRGALAVHAFRPDIEQSFDLQDEQDRWRYLCWLLTQGVLEFGLEPVAFLPGIVEFFASPSPAHPMLTRMAEFAYCQREDLRIAFNLNTRNDLAGMQNWLRGELKVWLDGLGLSSLQPDATIDLVEPAPPVQALIALAGDWDASSGVGEDLRSSVAALDACGFRDYVIVNFNALTIIAADRSGLPPGTRVHVTHTVVHRNADTALDDWFTLSRLGITSERYIGHWHWELERLPARWRHSFSFFDEIMASSRFAMDAFAAEDLRPVTLLNGAVTVPKPTATVTRRHLGLDEKATLFLFMFDFASYAVRKNPHAVVRAFAHAFPDGAEAVQLVLKTQNAALRPELWTELAVLCDDPRIVLKDEKLSRDELITLMATANAFVSLHRSEGYGRGPAEAMLLGVPAILTAYSGTMDFTDRDCACLVEYELVPVAEHDYPGVEGQRWAEASVEDAARHMRWIYEDPKGARKLGKRGRRRILDQLSPVKVGVQMVTMLTSNRVSDLERPSFPDKLDLALGSVPIRT